MTTTYKTTLTVQFYMDIEPDEVIKHQVKSLIADYFIVHSTTSDLITFVQPVFDNIFAVNDGISNVRYVTHDIDADPFSLTIKYDVNIPEVLEYIETLIQNTEPYTTIRYILSELGIKDKDLLPERNYNYGHYELDKIINEFNLANYHDAYHIDISNILLGWAEHIQDHDDPEIDIDYLREHSFAIRIGAHHDFPVITRVIS